MVLKDCRRYGYGYEEIGYTSSFRAGNTGHRTAGGCLVGSLGLGRLMGSLGLGRLRLRSRLRRILGPVVVNTTLRCRQITGWKPNEPVGKMNRWIRNGRWHSPTLFNHNDTNEGIVKVITYRSRYSFIPSRTLHDTFIRGYNNDICRSPWITIILIMVANLRVFFPWYSCIVLRGL
jgi:hypothetical protein